MSDSEAARHPELRDNVDLTSADKLDRANSGDWPDITPWYVSTSQHCPTILHETMHLLGLVDEYPETASGFLVDKKSGKAKWVEKDPTALGYDCRVLGPGSSIMSHQDAALARAKNGKEPLLFPGQWRMITSPGCLHANESYRNCGERAYRTSKALGGSYDCQPVPAECKLPGWLL